MKTSTVKQVQLPIQKSDGLMWFVFNLFAIALVSLSTFVAYGAK